MRYFNWSLPESDTSDFTGDLVAVAFSSNAVEKSDFKLAMAEALLTSPPTLLLVLPSCMASSDFLGDLDSCAIWISKLNRFAFEAASSLRLN